jgi:hypothetical protein
MKMIRIIKLLDLVVGFIGISLNALKISSFFVDREKHVFAELVMSTYSLCPGQLLDSISSSVISHHPQAWHLNKSRILGTRC